MQLIPIPHSLTSRTELFTPIGSTYMRKDKDPILVPAL